FNAPPHFQYGPTSHLYGLDKFYLSASTGLKGRTPSINCIITIQSAGSKKSGLCLSVKFPDYSGHYWRYASDRSFSSLFARSWFLCIACTSAHCSQKLFTIADMFASRNKESGNSTLFQCTGAVSAM